MKVTITKQVKKTKYNQNTASISTEIVNVFHQLKQYFVALLNTSSRSEAFISFKENALNGKDINNETIHTKLMIQNTNEACGNKRKQNSRLASRVYR